MAQRKARGTRDDPAEQAMRDQEVLRANRELAAYFKGLRTEREARAALKIIKAFVRARERQDPRHRPPLPGLRRSSTKRRAKPRPKRPPRRAPSETSIPREEQPIAAPPDAGRE